MTIIDNQTTQSDQIQNPTREGGLIRAIRERRARRPRPAVTKTLSQLVAENPATHWHVMR